MKRLTIIICYLIATTSVCAQHKGNYNQNESISRQNIKTAGNSVIYNPSVGPTLNTPLNPSKTITIDVKALHNVEATSFTAVFNLSQIGETAEEANQLINERINAVKSTLVSQGILPKDIVIDVISFVPVYDVEVEKKIFSTKYNEVPKGFELQQNLHIRFTKTAQFEKILASCAQNEIYNLVKVDYYIDNIAEVYNGLQSKLLEVIADKKAYYKLLSFDLAEYDVTIADSKYCYFPKNFYKSYQAYNSISFEAIKKKRGITEAKKQTSYYYEPLSFGDYDVVINPSILEPVIQVGMNIKLQFTPKPESQTKPETKTEVKPIYYLVSPDGNIDIKQLNTN